PKWKNCQVGATLKSQRKICTRPDRSAMLKSPSLESCAAYSMKKLEQAWNEAPAPELPAAALRKLGSVVAHCAGRTRMLSCGPGTAPHLRRSLVGRCVYP